MQRPEQPEREHPAEQPAQGQQLPGFDFLREWTAQLGLDKLKREPEKEQSEQKSPAFNKWTSSPGPDKSTDKLSMTADHTVSRTDFYKENPQAPKELKDIKQDARFKVRHPTTGEVDGDWRIVSSTDGKIRLQREYSMTVQKGKHDGLIEAMPGVSAAFVEQLQKKLDEIPQNVKDELGKAGYKIIAAPKITDALPGLRGMSPRGWSRSTTFDNSDGTHDNVSKRIVMPMKVKWQGEDWEDVHRPDVITHQIGHALDFANDFLSDRKEFMDAFTRDRARQEPNRDHPIMQYFSQPNGAGAQEAFASLFGMVLTGPENKTDREYLEKTFPLTIEVVKKQIKAMGRK